MKRLVFFVSMIFVLFSCASSKKVTQAEIDNLNALIQGKSFEIVSEWAEPQVTNSMIQIANAGMLPVGSNVGSINLTGNNNFLKMEGDTVSASLPFFGERQMGGSYGGTDIGVKFKGVPKKMNVTESKANSYKIKFSINDKESPSENYNVTVQVYPSLSTTIYVNSSHKSPIRYRGRVLNKTSKENKTRNNK
ncbi:conserved exported hypothetical protein [Tenacibaculum sediminilitoris]|uniref:DUF4251 domain-containing protein n=1 Tax=Tenacibaculum sediminilitoris TaxID=1820334 RepID=UPI00389459BE